jgi:hypothetical protein
MLPLHCGSRGATADRIIRLMRISAHYSFRSVEAHHAALRYLCKRTAGQASTAHRDAVPLAALFLKSSDTG